jgi:hypothetical protein
MILRGKIVRRHGWGHAVKQIRVDIDIAAHGAGSAVIALNSQRHRE